MFCGNVNQFNAKMFIFKQRYKYYLALCNAQTLKVKPQVSYLLVPERHFSLGRFLKNHNEKTSSQSSFKAFLKWPLAFAALISLGLFSYDFFLPNISGFPREARNHIRKALWARDKLHDIPEAIFHFKKAIEHMSQRLKNSESWHLVGTISELIELLILEERLSEAIVYYNEAIDILFSAGFDSPEKIKKQSKSLSFKTKNKLVSIKLELARLYHKLNDLANEKRSLDDAILLIFNEAFTTYADKGILDNHRQEIKLPRWLSAEETFSTLGQVADFYQSHDNPLYAIPLYQAAIHFCKVPIKRAILLCNLGSTCHVIGENSHAVKFFTEGLTILNKDQSNQDESLNAKATILFNLAMTYEAKAEFEKSQKVFEQLWSMKKQFPQFSSEKWSLVQSQLFPQG